MFNILKNITPEIIKKGLRPYIIEKKKVEKKYFCPVCNSDIEKFLPMSWSFLKNLDDNCCIHSIFAAETFNMIKYSCSICSATDRDRLYSLYINERFANLDQSQRYSFIEFAPRLSKKINSYPFINYCSADLHMKDVDNIVDITNLSIYKDNTFDIFLCSHVLEHVSNDKLAVKELYRILKPGGWGILMAPILLTLEHTYEDASITTEAGRWKHFGQHDHVRLYAKNDYVNLLENCGFKVLQLGIKYFGKGVFEKCGIHPRSILYVVEK